MCNRITGIGASLFFLYRDFNIPNPYFKRFSSNFDGAADPNSFMLALAAADPKYSNVKPHKFEVVIDELDGIQCIKASSVGGSLQQKWWFDLNRDFALLKFEDLRKDKNGNEQLYSSINITRIKEVAKNIWWPMEAYFVEHSHNTDKPWEKIVYRASDVIVNDPNFNNNIFTINFPKGYKTDDMINHKNYIVDANLNMIAEPNYSPHFKIIRKGNDR